MKIYPLKLKPVIKNAIWGGKQIPLLYSIGEPGQSCAEAWMLTLREDGDNVIENGPCTGMTLGEYVKLAGSDKVYGNGKFPLLIKIIDAADRLSVQVHPDDVYASQHGLDAGKTEMWYILDAHPGATLVCGIKPGITPEQIKKAAESGNCEQYLNTVPVKKGDCFFIPAGLVHAIGEGILIAEIQQNSNTTYRLYDYDRTDKNGNKRELHTDKASQVIKTSFDTKNVTVNKSITASNGVTAKILCECPMFSASSICISAGNKFNFSKSGHMLHIMCVSGSGVLESDNVKYSINKGDSYLLPLALSDACAKAVSDMELIISH